MITHAIVSGTRKQKIHASKSARNEQRASYSTAGPHFVAKLIDGDLRDHARKNSPSLELRDVTIRIYDEC